MKKYILKIVGLLAVLPFVLTACLDSDYTPPDYDAIFSSNLAAVDPVQLAKDKQAIDDSLENWEIGNVLIEPRSGVRYTIEQLGTGPKPVLAGAIAANYEGRLLVHGPGGEPFDEGDNMQQYLYNLILGWRAVLPLLPEGTHATLYIPSGLAYGPEDQKDQNGDIVLAKNSIFIFKIELVGVANPN